MFNLPQHIISLIFSYDSTYHNYFKNIIIKKMKTNDFYKLYCYNCHSHKLSSFSYNFCYNVTEINYHFYSSYQVCDTCFPDKLSYYFYCTKRLTTEFDFFDVEQFTLFLKTMKKYKLNFIKVNNV